MPGRRPPRGERGQSCHEAWNGPTGATRVYLDTSLMVTQPSGGLHQPGFSAHSVELSPLSNQIPRGVHLGNVAFVHDDHSGGGGQHGGRSVTFSTWSNKRLPVVNLRLVRCRGLSAGVSAAFKYSERLKLRNCFLRKGGGLFCLQHGTNNETWLLQVPGVWNDTSHFDR